MVLLESFFHHHPLQPEVATPGLLTAFVSFSNDAGIDAEQQNEWPPFKPPSGRIETPGMVAELGGKMVSAASAMFGGADDEIRDDDAPGPSPSDLDNLVEDAHDSAMIADRSADTAQTEVESAMLRQRFLGRAVDTAERDWEGALHAKKISDELSKVSVLVHGLKEVRDKLSNTMSRVNENCTPDRDPNDPEVFEGIGRAMYRLRGFLPRAEPYLKRIVEEEEKLNDLMTGEPRAPPLYPPLGGPGLENGMVAVPTTVSDISPPGRVEDFLAPPQQGIDRLLPKAPLAIG